MGSVRNILFIMCDQLRWDYLSCNGHPRLETPYIDGLAAKGVNFSRPYCNVPVCGGSRMSFYTGRYAFTHGATWNGVALPVGERTLGDYLRPAGQRVALVGKTHQVADREGMARLHIDPSTVEGILLSECGFEPYERDDGLWGMSTHGPPELAYNNYLRQHGFNGENPWHDWANSAEGPNGEVLSAWNMRNCKFPARVPEEHSETAYMTNRAMEFIKECGDDQTWTLHLSYIKPHWPYIAPAPYHAMYGGNDVLPANKHPRELETDHPLYRALQERIDCINFSKEEVRQTVIPAYMGLIKQIDDHLGRLWKFLENNGRMEDTLIVLTSDHGDYLGDHWLGEKEFFHEESIKIPLIIYDPDPAADATRGTVQDRYIESIDLVPTFLDTLGIESPSHILEGCSLLPLIRGQTPVKWREHVICESEYAARVPFKNLGITADQARAIMVMNDQWKYVRHNAFRGELFDRENDPHELTDLGGNPAYEETCRKMDEVILESLAGRKFRTTYSNELMEERARRVFERPANRPVMIGEWE